MGRYAKVKINGRTLQAHRVIYEAAHGPIPEGFHIHHRDGDPTNNALENLQALSPAEHSRHHNDRHPRVKACAACGDDFEPEPTKRERAKTCSRECFRALLARPRTPTERVEAIRADIAAGLTFTAIRAKHAVGHALYMQIRNGTR